MIFDPILDLFRGKAVTIPPMDGAFQAEHGARRGRRGRWRSTAPDNLCLRRQRISLLQRRRRSVPGAGQATSRSAVEQLRRDGHRAGGCRSAPSPSPATTERIAIDGGKHADKRLTPASLGNLACPTALAFDDADHLWSPGLGRHRASDWAVDLMEKNAGGSVWRIDLATGAAQRLAGDLAFPYGILVQGERDRGGESWRHRLVAASRARAARRSRS